MCYKYSIEKLTNNVMRRGNILPIALMAFALVGFLFVLSYAITKDQKWPWSTNVQTTNTTINRNTSIDGTADWKTYTSLDGVYTVKYPVTYTAEKCSDGVVNFAVMPEGASSLCDGIYQGIDIEARSEATIDAAVNTLSPTVYSVTKSTAMIDGLSATRLQWSETNDMGGMARSWDVYLVNTSYGVYGIMNSDATQESTFAQFITTIQFVNSASAPTADWKTYTDTTNGFTMKYPPSWTYKYVTDLQQVQFTKSGNDIIQPTITVRAVTPETYQDELKSNLATIGSDLTMAVGNTTIGGFTYTGATGAGYDVFFYPAGTQSLVLHSRHADADWATALGTFTRQVHTAGWSTYTNNTYDYAFQHSSKYVKSGIYTSPDHVVFRQENCGECTFSVKVSAAPASLTAWKDSYDESSILRVLNTTVDNTPALRIETREFARVDIGVIHNKRLYVLSGGGFVDEGLQPTFTFTQ